MLTLRNYAIEPESLIQSQHGINVAFIESQCPKVTAIAHIHSSIEFLYFTRGEFKVTVNEESFLLNEGDLILFPKYSIHSATALSDSGGSYYVFQVHPTIIKDIVEPEREDSFQFFFSLDNVVANLIWRKAALEESGFMLLIQDIIKEYDSNDYFSAASQKLSLFRLLLAIIRNPQKRTAEAFDKVKIGTFSISYVHKAYEYINANYANDISAEDFANSLNISYKYFLDCFSRATGEGFKAYLNKTRIKHAKSKLINSNASISEVGSAVGYNSTSYFILEFKKQTGMTPLQYVKKYRDKGVEF